jgi:hypothetical protein
VAGKERERSPERKNIQKLSAAALEVLVRLGDNASVAAVHIARHVNDWPGMGAQQVTGKTVVAWRSSSSGARRRPGRADSQGAPSGWRIGERTSWFRSRTRVSATAGLGRFWDGRHDSRLPMKVLKCQIMTSSGRNTTRPSTN